MWVIRLVLFLVLLFLLVYFFVTNAGQTVDLNLFGREYLDLGLYWIAGAAFGLGLLAAFVGMGLREFRLRRELSRQRKLQAGLERELADLRALPLQELTNPDAAGKGD
ncbi:MAG: LapA family protein [Candidatus Krumholzibacteriia bacterium]